MKIRTLVENVKKHPFYWLIGLVAVIIVCIVLAFEITCLPGFCGSCHYMKPYYSEWKTSPHKEVACVECHINPGVVNLVSEKFKATHELSSMITGKLPPRPHAQVDDVTCLRKGCHQTEDLSDTIRYGGGISFSHVSHLDKEQMGMKMRCATCHSQMVDGKHIGVHRNACVLCHTKKSKQGGMYASLSECLSCHTIPDSGAKESEPMASHVAYVAEGFTCLDCHEGVCSGSGNVDPMLCNWCHKDPEQRAKINDAELIHKKHVTDHKVECYMCHVTIEHNLSQYHKCYHASLHHTGEGMRHWYNAKDGFSAITGIAYDKLSCKNCHSKSCGDCHRKETEEGVAFSKEIAGESATCLKCHAREKATIKIDEARGTMGTHMQAGMACIDCHSLKEIHGDGSSYKSMRQSGAMDAACTKCHDEVPETRSHAVHKDKLACNACHVQNSMTCYNCHFGEFARTKSKPKSFAAKAKDFLLLVKYKGKVTSGTMQTLVGENNEPFVVYVPYFTHSIMKEGRKCNECHATEAANMLAASRAFSPVTFKDGKPDFYSGVIPVYPDLLKWEFLEKKEGIWQPFTPEKKPLVQMGVYAEPFTQDDLKKLKTGQNYEE
jgi:nitrate/TMAO reductase-like tetraheme cytochrome c subunit